MTVEVSKEIQGAPAQEPQGILQRLMASSWVLVLVLGLSFFWQLGSVPLYDVDEGAFTEATREMLASGDYITPRKDGEPRYDKPVLIYWLQAASVKVFGLNEFALRLPSALAASLWVLGLWVFVRARLGTETAAIAALVLTLSLQVSLIAKAAVADAVLNLFIALTFFEIYRFYLEPDPAANRRFILRAYLWMALGFLTKGPVAVFFPVAVSFVFFAWEAFRSWSGWSIAVRWFRAAFSADGWWIFILVAAPWFLAIFFADGDGFFRSFFLQHNAGRFNSTMQGHGGSLGYYLAFLPLIISPFIGWFLSLFKLGRRLMADPLDRLMWLWFLAVFGVFSLSHTQLPHYLLYGCTPLFVLMARHRDLLTNRWLAFLPVFFLFGLLLIVPWLLDAIFATVNGIANSPSHEVRAMLELKPGEAGLLDAAKGAFGGRYVMAVFSVLSLSLGLFLWSKQPLWLRLMLAGVLQMLVVSGQVVPRVFDVLQAPVKEAALMAKELDRPTVVYRTAMPSFSVYREAITPAKAPVAGDLVFLRLDKLDGLIKNFPQLTFEPLYRRGQVGLFEARKGD